MTDNASADWKIAKATDVQIGDTIRTLKGDVLTVSRIETEFLGRPAMMAFIEDTDERWYKRPVATNADVEIRLP